MRVEREIAMLPDLTTPRLVLRELSAGYAPALQKLQDARRDDPGRSSTGDIEDAATRVANYEKYRGHDGARRIMSYVAMTDGTLIGTASLSCFRHPCIGSLGFFVADAFQNRGFATELGVRLLQFGFQHGGMHRIEADVEVGNLASQRVLERIGMLREGVMRDCTFAGGRWWTDARYAILASEWARQPAAIAPLPAVRAHLLS
jgi:RimJ/RimL family protein N-acetyltransferase